MEMSPSRFTVRRRRTPAKRKPAGEVARFWTGAWKGTETLEESSGSKMCVPRSLCTSLSDHRLKTGMRVWVKSCAFCDWPGVVWSIDATPRTKWPQLIKAYVKGKILVLFYGDRLYMWVFGRQLSGIEDKMATRILRLNKWACKHGKRKIAEMTQFDLECSSANPEAEMQRLQAGSYFAPGSPACDFCGESGPELHCKFCTKWFHPLCISSPCTEFDAGSKAWTCPRCSCQNEGDAEHSVLAEEAMERTGLTPDWVIQTSVYRVFQLQRPSKRYPFIRGLLDPCTNSKLYPNIPAEKLYDKRDNGLKLSNAWKGYYVLLNPDYKAQRLRPYPRVFLRRQSIKFKNYEHTPIGFGIVVFCIARNEGCHGLFSRFVEAFAPYGEPNIAIDEGARSFHDTADNRALLASHEFPALLERLREHAGNYQRDNWIQCSECCKWRIVSYEMLVESKNQEWTCKDLRLTFTDCSTPQTRAELKGVNYAVGIKNDVSAEIDGIPLSEISEDSHANLGSEILSCNPSTCGEDRTPDQIACRKTLKRLATIPPRSNALSLLRFDPMTDTRGYQGNPVLTSLELARQAHEAANRAYLKGLGKSPSAIHMGEIKYVHPTDDLALEASRTTVQKAKIAEAQLQVQQAQRQFEAIRRKRQIEEGRINKKLDALQNEEKELFSALKISQAAIKEIKSLDRWQTKDS